MLTVSHENWDTILLTERIWTPESKFFPLTKFFPFRAGRRAKITFPASVCFPTEQNKYIFLAKAINFQSLFNSFPIPSTWFIQYFTYQI